MQRVKRIQQESDDDEILQYSCGHYSICEAGSHSGLQKNHGSVHKYISFEICVFLPERVTLPTRNNFITGAELNLA